MVVVTATGPERLTCALLVGCRRKRFQHWTPLAPWPVLAGALELNQDVLDVPELPQLTSGAREPGADEGQHLGVWVPGSLTADFRIF